MPFSPDSTIFLLNVPLTANNQNQIDFADKAAQTAYFQSRIVRSFNNYTYQRKEGYIRVGVEADLLWRCNYVMYQNANFTDKWFYAFITRVEYINPSCTFLHIKTDVFQTWQFDIKYFDSYVIREHVANDEIGRYTESEPLETVCYPVSAERMTPRTDSTTDCIVLFFSKTPTAISGVFNVGTNSGAESAQKYKGYHSLSECLTDIEALELAGELQLVDDVGTAFANYDADISLFVSGGENEISITEPPFAPVNNKSLNYCYSTIQGNDTLKIDIPLLKTNVLKYSSFGCYGTSPYVMIKTDNPINATVNYDSYPQAKIPTNTALNDIAKTLNTTYKTIPSTVFSGAINSAFRGSNSGLMNSASNLFSGTISTFSGLSTENIQPTALSAFSPSNARYTAGFAGVWLIKYAPNQINFEKIDNFFSMYGYALNVVKTPNFKSRVNWNYIKTQNINLTADAPQDDIDELKTIFNTGLTVWHNPQTFGDYSQFNGVKV